LIRRSGNGGSSNGRRVLIKNFGETLVLLVIDWNQSKAKVFFGRNN
jgi:hypothetical protein